jgi:hypothetical protein
MAKVRYPNVDSVNRVSHYITLSSSGFPDPNNSQDGATLEFIDAQFDSHYVQYKNMWVLDLNNSRGYEHNGA